MPPAAAIARGDNSASELTAGTPTQPVQQVGSAVVKDPLDDDSNGWGIVNSEDGHHYYEGGAYVAGVGNAPSLHWLPESLATKWDQGNLDLSNVVVRTKATTSRGEAVVGGSAFERNGRDTGLGRSRLGAGRSTAHPLGRVRGLPGPDMTERDRRLVGYLQKLPGLTRVTLMMGAYARSGLTDAPSRRMTGAVRPRATQRKEAP